MAVLRDICSIASIEDQAHLHTDVTNMRVEGAMGCMNNSEKRMQELDDPATRFNINTQHTG